MLPSKWPCCYCHACGDPLLWDAPRQTSLAPWYWSRQGAVLCFGCFGSWLREVPFCREEELAPFPELVGFELGGES